MDNLNAKSPVASFHVGRSASHDVATTPEKMPEQTVGLKIRALRRAAGMSLREIGEAVGVSLVQFQRYETGVSQLSTTRLLTISKVLGMQIGSLLGEPILTVSERLAGLRRQEDRELSRLFATLSEPAGRRAVLLFVRDTAAREELLHAHEKLSSPSPVRNFDLAHHEIEQ
jgi:transcriptional regulator with XRE-family HTH domain